MSVESICNKIIPILKNSTISHAIKKLLDINISRLIIKDENKPIRIITEKDIGFFLFSEKTKQSLDDILLQKL